MKRHPSLEPFSRDHDVALGIARRLMDDEDYENAIIEFNAIWQDELEEHFHEEERLLLPLCRKPFSDRMKAEHVRLDQFAKLAREGALTKMLVRMLGECLRDHVRWEERELFPAIEEYASDAELTSLGEATEWLERRRANSAHSDNRGVIARRKEIPIETTPMADLKYLGVVAKFSGAQWGLESQDLNGTMLWWKQGEGVDPHVNSDVDVLIIAIDGEAEVIVNGVPHPITGGQVVLIPKGSERSIRAVSPTFSHLNVHKRRRGLQVGQIPSRAS